MMLLLLFICFVYSSESMLLRFCDLLTSCCDLEHSAQFTVKHTSYHDPVSQHRVLQTPFGVRPSEAVPRALGSE
jgi:hypothetical protein